MEGKFPTSPYVGSLSPFPHLPEPEPAPIPPRIPIRPFPLPPPSSVLIGSCSTPMGCGASKAVPNGEGEKEAGLFRLGGQEKNRSSVTLSSKELLTNEGSKRLPESYDDLDKEEPEIKNPHLHEKKTSEGALKEKFFVSAGGSDDKQLSGSSDVKKVRGESDEKRISGGASNDKGEEEEEDDEDEDDVVGVVGLGFGNIPSSPSFREYFRSADNLENGDAGKVIRAKEGEDRVTIRKGQNSTDSIEDAEDKMGKKGGGKLRGLAKGPGSMYKSFNIAACYNASATDSPRQRSVKAN